MFKKAIWFGVVVLALALFAASAVACDSVPQVLADAFDSATPTDIPLPTDTPTPVPTAAPTSAPQPAAPAAPQGQARRAAGAAAGLATLMKNAGLQGGVVTTNTASALGLKLGQNSSQVTIGADTIVVLPTKNPATISDVQVGDRVLAKTTPGNSAGAASLVLDLPTGYTVGNVILGAVQSNDNGTLTLRARGGTRSVTANDTTTVVNLSGNPATLGSIADLGQGNAVLIIGSGSANSFDAQVVVVLAQNARTLLQRLAARRRAAPGPTPGP